MHLERPFLRLLKFIGYVSILGEIVIAFIHRHEVLLVREGLRDLAAQLKYLLFLRVWLEESLGKIHHQEAIDTVHVIILLVGVD